MICDDLTSLSLSIAYIPHFGINLISHLPLSGVNLTPIHPHLLSLTI